MDAQKGKGNGVKKKKGDWKKENFRSGQGTVKGQETERKNQEKKEEKQPKEKGLPLTQAEAKAGGSIGNWIWKYSHTIRKALTQ